MNDGERPDLPNDETFPTDLTAFLDRFPTDTACRNYLQRVRWPQGVVCPRCGSGGGWPTARGTWFCAQCRRQTSPTAGTILHNSRTPIRKWFVVAWLLGTQESGVSAKTIQRELKLGYKTAWLILQKLRQAMARSERGRLRGMVQVDETCLTGGEPGMGAHQLVDKPLVAIAVELGRKPVGRVRLRCIPDRSAKSLVGFLNDTVTKGAIVETDEWEGYKGLRAAGFIHHVTPICDDAERARKFCSPVHVVASSLSRWLGATHQRRVQRKHLQGYLDEYAFRFNRDRSLGLGEVFHCLVEQMVIQKAKPHRQFVKEMAVS